MEKKSFSSLPISEEIKKAVAEMGFEEPTYIQAESIPRILEGKDIVGHSQTGTGKTAAFGIPILEQISKEQKGATQALVLCPTRELAIQACEEIRKFAKYKHGIKAVPIYGGQPIDRQIRTLKAGAEIVIGTPGRIMDHLRRKTLKLQNLNTVVLDEADEMLNMGFREDIETILKYVPEERQTILFSATMPPAILRITKQFQKNPEIIEMIQHKLTVPKINQYYYEVPNGKKIDAVSRLLDFYNPNRCIIFCNTKRMVDQLVNQLQLRGYTPDGLHGDMKQTARTKVMNAFKSGKIDILIATDVAARGIDVDDIDTVINYDLPQDAEYYVHRIGRTGRAGKAGTAHTLVSGRKLVASLKDIERHTKSKITLKPLPSVDEIQELRHIKLIEKVTAVLKGKNFYKYEFIVDKLMEDDYTSVEIASAVLQLLAENGSEIAVVEIEEGIHDARSQRKQAARVKTKKKPERKIPREDMDRLIVSVGRRDRVAPNHIIAAIAGESGLPGDIIGKIEVYDNYTFVEVPKEETKLILDSMQGCVIKGRDTTTELVKNKKRRPRRG